MYFNNVMAFYIFCRLRKNAYSPINDNRVRWSFIAISTGFFLAAAAEIRETRQVSSMIHSARPAVSPVANIAFALFCFARFWKVGMDGHSDGRHVQKQWSITGRDCGSAEWIKRKYFLKLAIFLLCLA